MNDERDVEKVETEASAAQGGSSPTQRVYAPASARVAKPPVPGHEALIKDVDESTPERRAAAEDADQATDERV